MDKNKNEINTFKLGDATLSNDLLTSIFEQINTKLDAINQTMAEMKTESQLTNKDVESTLKIHDSRINVLENDKEINAKIPLKTEIGNKLFSGVISSISYCVGISLFVSFISTFHIPVISVVKSLFLAVGAN